MDKLTLRDIERGEDRYRNVARRRGVRDADEVVARVQVALWKKISDGKRVDRALEGLVLNGHVIDQLRRESRELPVAVQPGFGFWDERPSAPARPIPPPDLDGVLFAADLRRALLGMPREWAVPWALVNMLGLPVNEAAGYVGASPRTTYRNIENARLRLCAEVTP